MVDRQTAMVAVNLQTIRHTTAGEHRNTRSKLSPFSSPLFDNAHTLLYPSHRGQERATPIHEYRAVFAVFMRARYRGDALKAHSKGFVVFVLDTR